MADEKKALAYEESENKIAETPDPRDAATVTRTNPDAGKRPGTPPVLGQDGERGSSAFAGNDLFNEDGSLKDGVVPTTHYPLKGVEYWEGATPTGNHA